MVNRKRFKSNLIPKGGDKAEGSKALRFSGGVMRSKVRMSIVIQDGSGVEFSRSFDFRKRFEVECSKGPSSTFVLPDNFSKVL